MCSPFFGGGGGIYIIGIYIFLRTVNVWCNMSDRNVGADFYAYLATLGCTEAEFKSLLLVDRSTIHLNFGNWRCL